jgi:hypothetical protein
MEFVDIHFYKRLECFASCNSLVPSTGGFKRRPYSYLVLKILTKKIREKENSGLFTNSILSNGKMRVENQIKASLYPGIATKNAIK